MQFQLKDKNDIKIFILFLLRNINYPLEFADINDIVVQDEIVNCIDFAECFAELLETNNIEEIKHENILLYQITEQGIQVADTLQSNLLNYIRTRSLKSALRLLSFKRRGSSVSAKGERREDKRFDLVCSIIEDKEEIFNLKITVDNIGQVEKMKYNFYDKPEVIYRGILALLSGEANYLID